MSFHKRLLALLISIALIFSFSIPVYASGGVTITFNFQGGVDGTSNVYLQSQTATLPDITVPTRRGYSFLGYYTEATGKGTQYYNEKGKPIANVVLASDIILFASWKIRSYDITYTNMEGATSSVLPQSHTYGINTTIPTPIKEGYTFFGWQVNGSAISQQNLTLDKYAFSAGINLTAVWNKAILVTRNNNTTQTVTISDSDLQSLFYSQVTDSNKGVTAFDLNSEQVELVMTASDADKDAEGAEEVISMAQGDVMRLYDFSISKKVTKQGQSPVSTELQEVPITVQVDIELCEELSAKTGYRIYRFHNGEPQAIPIGPISDSTKQKEFFTVSEDGLTLTIYTRRLSTYAVVANTKSVESDNNNGTGMDVQARMIVSSYGAVYQVDIVWGDMKFYYSNDAIWNPELHVYDENSKFEWHEKMSYENGNNVVRVYNHSNADIMVSMYVTNPQLPGVDININSTNAANGMAAENMLLARVSSEGADAYATDGYVRLTGTPENWENLDSMAETNGFTKIANIAVTITHINSPLTPKK